MDKAEIKRQISYWEAQLKEGERTVKIQQDQNAVVKQTIKSLKALLPKEKEEYNEVDFTNPDEVNPVS